MNVYQQGCIGVSAVDVENMNLIGAFVNLGMTEGYELSDLITEGLNIAGIPDTPKNRMLVSFGVGMSIDFYYPEFEKDTAE